MSNYKDNNAANALRSYVWKLLEANLGWTKDDYKGLVPIFPLSQEPEPKEIGKAFLVYNSSQRPAEHLYVQKCETIGYSIYANTVADLNTITTLLQDTFDRQDDAAADVNQWLDTEQQATGISRGISFGSIKTILVDRSDPADNEGGYVSSLVMVEAKYVTQNNTITTADFTYP